MGLELGLLGIIWLILAIWAIIHIVQSDTSPLGKAIWIAVVLFLLPPVGFLIWLFFGPRSRR
jgi:multisubunit Na+/H+ antiporter MnhG subunit